MKLLIPCFLLISFSCFGQENEKRGTIKIEKSNCVRLENNDSVYAYVDMMPQFPGGMDSLNKWMNDHLLFPKSAMEENGFGTVFLSFVVKKDGTISNVVVLKGMDKDFEKEALRLMDVMPDWVPGRCNGTLSDVKINFPIKFGLK